MDIINLVLGVVLLTTGKKLYWLFVAIVGFVIGLALATQYVQLNPPWLVYVVALVVGVIGAVVATFLQHLAIALVGFIAGGYGAMYIFGLLGKNPAPYNWMAFIIGGIIGLFLVASIFNWALYILSSWAGATLVTKAISLQQAKLGLILFFVLFVLGMIIQAGLFRERPKQQIAAAPPQPEPEQKPE